jgi:hypothetical protein
LSQFRIDHACAEFESQVGEAHYDSAFTQKTYIHASDDDLQRGQAALAKIHEIA